MGFILEFWHLRHEVGMYVRILAGMFVQYIYIYIYVSIYVYDNYICA